MSEITGRDREIARELLNDIMKGLVRVSGLPAVENAPKSHAGASDGNTRKAHVGRFEIALLVPISEAIATAREEGRTAREHELLALTDRDFIIISREEYNRLNGR